MTHPAAPASAATVMLLSDATPGIGVYVHRRARTLSFAPDALVFPGGALEPGDTGVPLRLSPAAQHLWRWARGNHHAPPLAQVLGAAAREVFEECGVLLCEHADQPGQWVDSALSRYIRDAYWERVNLRGPEQTSLFAKVLGHYDLVVRGDALRPWSRWITPESQPRRFDAFIIAAATPPGQRPEHRAFVTEATSGGVRAAREVLAELTAGSVHALPPTRAALTGLAAFDRIDAVLATPRACPPTLGQDHT